MLHKFKLYINIYPKFHNYISSDYFQISNIALNNVYNNIFRLELNYNEFNKLIQQLDKNDFKEKLIVFNLLKNEQDNEKKNL